METTPTKTPAARYSTKEIAARLFLSEQKARAILQAAGIPCTKAGNSYLWDGQAVEHLIAALRLEGGHQ